MVFTIYHDSELGQLVRHTLVSDDIAGNVLVYHETDTLQARTQGGGVRWVRTNPPLRSQLQNDKGSLFCKLDVH